MKHILVVDDEQEIRDVLQMVLARQCFRVTCASSGSDARRVVREDPPDLIITDLQMADTDGLELVEQLKVMAPEVPVMLLTGIVFDPQVLRDTVSKKVASYVEKASPLSKIMSEVRRLLGE
jgi:DNA-binding NtrC family response regulator